MRKWAGGIPNENAVVIEGIIPPIIDTFLWERVQKRVNNRTRNAANGAKREYLLSGLIYCGKCGGAYIAITQSKREKTYYVCGNKRQIKNCDAKNISAEDIETLVVSLLKNDVLNGDLIEDTADKMLVARKNSPNVDTEKIKKEIAECTRKINNATKAILNGLDSDAVRVAL